jgi:hypothetical protein
MGGKAAKTGPLRMLIQVHEKLVGSRPGGDASLAVWLGYYQRSVALYEQIAEIDPFPGLEADIGRGGSDTTQKRSGPRSRNSRHARNDGARRASVSPHCISPRLSTVQMAIDAALALAVL